MRKGRGQPPHLIRCGGQRWLSAVWLLVLVVIVANAKGQEQRVEVQSLGPALIETKPREVDTVFVRITNFGPAREFDAKINMPQGWQLITPSFPFQLEKGKAINRMLSFVVSQETLAGMYEIEYIVTSEDRPIAGATFDVRVLPVVGLQVRLTRAPRFVVAGEKYEAEFLVTNQGNAVALVDLKVKSGQNYPAKMELKQLSLEPGESRKVAVLVKTDKKIRDKVSHNLNLTAKIEGKISQTANSQVTVFPRQSGVEEHFFKIPAQIVLLGAINEAELKPETLFGQVEFSGEGFLSERKERKVNFLFRGPNRRQGFAFGLREEYRFSYETKDLFVGLGDRTYELSPLLEPYGYGRGGEVDIALAGLRWRAFYRKSWWQKKDHLGVSVSYPVIEGAGRISLNGFYPGDKEKNSCSIYVLLPWEHLNVETEYALGRYGGRAFYLKALGAYKGITTRVGITEADAEFPGYYRDRYSRSVSLTLPLVYGLRANASYNDQKQKQLDSWNQYFQTGLNYRMPFVGTSLSLNYNERHREGFLVKGRTKEQGIRTTLSQSFRYGSCYLSADFSKADHQSQDIQRYRASIYLRPIQSVGCSGWFQTDNGYAYYTDVSERRDSAGLNVWLRLFDKTFFDVNLQRSKSSGLLKRELVNARLKQALPYGNIVFEGRAIRRENEFSGQEIEVEGLFQYTFPFGIPVSRKNTAVLKGKILDFRNGQGIPNVIVRVSRATVITDEKGGFIFHLSPGKYYLTLEGLVNKVTIQDVPMEVVLEAEEEIEIDIEVTDSAKLEGEVRIYAPKGEVNPSVIAADGKVKERGLSNLLIEITSGKRVHRRLTDNNGQFVFRDLLPGKWLLTVYEDNLPRLYYLEKKLFALEVKSAQENRISVRVLPKLRKIKFIDKGQEIAIE